MALVGWLHVALLRLVLWVARFLGRSLWNTVGAFLALLGEEVRRYLGLALWGAVIWLVGTATMNYAPQQAKTPLVLIVLGLVVIWGLAVVRSIRFTMRNSLRDVRNRRFFRELRGEVRGLGDRLQDGLGDARDGLARRTRDTPFGGVFRANRDAARQAEADAQEAAERAEVERREAQRQAEADRLAKEERDRYLERVGAEHNPFERQGS